MPLWRRLAILTSLAIGLFYTARIATQPVPVNAALMEAAAGGYTTFTRKIEDVRPGDLVLSRDEHGTTIAPRSVKEVYRRTSYHLRNLTFRDDSGHQQTLQTTDEHPFWSVSDNAFVDAGELEAGAKVTSPNGNLQTLVATSRDERPDGVPVFNFQVDGFHTYYVAESTTADVLLVHNADYPDAAFGLEAGLNSFRDTVASTGRNVEAWPFLTFHPGDGTLVDVLDSAMRKAPRLHANMADIEPAKYQSWLMNGGPGNYPTAGNVANYELNVIYTNPEFFGKTTFYGASGSDMIPWPF
jgi:hypothetical protein